MLEYEILIYLSKEPNCTATFDNIVHNVGNRYSMPVETKEENVLLALHNLKDLLKKVRMSLDFIPKDRVCFSGDVSLVDELIKRSIFNFNSIDHYVFSTHLSQLEILADSVVISKVLKVDNNSIVDSTRIGDYMYLLLKSHSATIQSAYCP